MRILVTGGAGFIGSHVADAYVQAGYDVWVLDNLSRGRREQVNPHAHFVCMDLCSPDLKDLLAHERFDCINHHAAQIDVRSSVADPCRDARINILGTLNLLEGARAHGISRLIFASTGGAIYGEQQCFPATEQQPTAPLSPYGVAKLAVEHYLEYYQQVHGIRYVILRYANVYGPRQDLEGEAGVVAIFCGRILRGQRLSIYGDGEQTRDYVYVEDVARANLLALHHLAEVNESRESGESVKPGERIGSVGSMECGVRTRPGLSNSRSQEVKKVLNIGTGIETSVNALVAMLLEAADTDSPVVYLPGRPGEQARSAIDPRKASHILGWSPLTPLAEGLLQTLAWFRIREAGSVQRSAISPIPMVTRR
jgi:UDP-glucose 4-epimerase